MGMANNTGGLTTWDYKFNDTVWSTDSPYVHHLKKVETLSYQFLIFQAHIKIYYWDL